MNVAWALAGKIIEGRTVTPRDKTPEAPAREDRGSLAPRKGHQQVERARPRADLLRYLRSTDRKLHADVMGEPYPTSSVVLGILCLTFVIIKNIWIRREAIAAF